MGACLSQSVAGVSSHVSKKKSSKSGSSANAKKSAKSTEDVSEKNPRQHLKGKEKSGKKLGAAFSSRKNTNFGYSKDFDRHYQLGKLLGHGQFGFTFVATKKGSGDRVAVKRIDKSKVRLFHFRDCKD